MEQDAWVSFKVILWDLTRDENCDFSLFLHHQIMNLPWLSLYFKSLVYSYWLLYIKLKYSEYNFSYTIVWGILDREILVKGKKCRFCHNYNSYNSFHINKILSILNVLSICINYKKNCCENVQRGYISKSRNIALRYGPLKLAEEWKFTNHTTY